MKLFGVLLFVALSVASISADLNWDLGEWIPIPGKCATCDEGRHLFLHSDLGRSSGTLLSSENKRRKKAFSSGSSDFDEASIFALQPKSDDDSSRVQLVYLPEGSINDLRTAKVAKVSKRSKARSRRIRSAPFPIPDQITGESRLSFREISPRRPTALVAERGKEREAQEQIQLLEAALNSPPEEVRDGELPRVFIAPTHLPPPPGYVKIPLLPTQNQVNNKRILPGTFLTSEIHNQLPPGFVQVPLPEKVSQLSHSIPFVNPNSSPILQGMLQQHNRQQEQQQLQQKQQQQDFRNPNIDFGQFHTDSSRQPQHFDPPQPVQQDFHTEQPFQHNIQTEQPVSNFDVNKIAQNHFNIRRPINQNFDREQIPRGQDIHQNSNTQAPHQTFNQQEHQPVSQPEQHTVREHQNTAFIGENFHQEPLFENQKDRQPTIDTNRHTNQDGVRPQRIKLQNNRESVQNIPTTTTSSPLTFKPHTNSFFEIGSSVIKPQNDFDYDPFNNLPSFNAGNDYEQDFLLYDNQDFNLPNNTPDKSRGSVTNTKQNNQEPTPETHPQTGFIEENVPSTIQADNIVITETPRIVPFQLSPKPINIFPTLSPFPIETVSKEPEVAQINNDFEHAGTQKPSRIQLSPKPVEETGNIATVEETSSTRLNNRRRLRPTSFRGRTPNSSSRHRLNLSPKKVEDSQVTIGAPVVTKDVLEETVSDASQTSLPSLPTRNRFNNRRRRPIKQETAGTTTIKVEVVTEIVTTPKPAERSSTLFPPFSVAKRLNENPTEAQENGSRRNLPDLRGRFGSRIRARTQENDSPKISETGTQDSLTTEPLPQRSRGQRRRRIRVRNGNGQPSGKRRRRVLNRVRKIDPEPSEDNLNNQIQKEEQLSGAESARVEFSQAPLNKVIDPISETFTLIKDENTNNDTRSIFQNTEDSEKKPSSEIHGNIFSLLNLTPSTTEEINNLRKVSTKRSSLNHDLHIAGDTEGYVNNSEPLSLLNHSFDEPSTRLVSLESESSIPKHDISTLDTIVSNNNNESPTSFDSLLSTLAQSTHISTEPESSGTVLDGTHAEHDRSHLDLQHSTPHNPVENDEENAPLLNDNIHNLLPENETGLQDNYYDYDNDNGTFFGSSAHVVYAVALSESPPEESDLTTQIPNVDSTADQAAEDFQSLTDIENNTDSLSEDVHETTLASLVADVSPDKPSSEPLDEISEAHSNLEVIKTTESSISQSESTTKFSDTTSFVKEILMENINLPQDSNIQTENEESVNDTAVVEHIVPESEIAEEISVHLEEENDNKSTSNVDSEATTELAIDNNETNTETFDESLDPTTNDLLGRATKNSTKNFTEHNQSSNNLTSNFSNDLFPAEREGKENNIEVEDGSPIIIGRSTVTEVRSSAPVICIEGNCVIGAGIRKR